jgi:hypothetical protein
MTPIEVSIEFVTSIDSRSVRLRHPVRWSDMALSAELAVMRSGSALNCHG